MKPIILASTSPRRKELMALTGLDFTTTDSGYEEDMTLPLPPDQLVGKLSHGKASTCAHKFPNSLIIGADTIVVHDGQVLGKPHTPERAKEMIKLLSGTTHSIWTGLTVIDTETNKAITKSIEAVVQFATLSDDEIERYVALGDCLDKAGAYAIQGSGALFVEKIIGEHSTIVGLPLRELALTLKEFGIQVP